MPPLARLRIALGRHRQKLLEHYLWRKEGRPLRAGRLMDAPPVIYMIHNGVSWHTQLLSLSHRFREPGLLLLGFWWVQGSHDAAQAHLVKAFLKRRMPGWEMVVLCNSEAEHALYRGSDLRAELINQNAFVDEAIFRPLSISKDFDAIYDAQLMPFKRHLLAAKIPSLSLISYRYAMNYNAAYGQEVHDALTNATWVNDPLSEHHQKLSADEVARELNRARVGLCLSGEEGAMYASIQYLLCGLPVVTTRSVGGRDEFFDSENCRVVEPTADAVASAVRDWVAAPPDPIQIRERVLAKMRIHRERLIAVVQGYLDRRGVHVDYAAEFRRRFINKLFVPTPVDQL